MTERSGFGIDCLSLEIALRGAATPGRGSAHPKSNSSGPAAPSADNPRCAVLSIRLESVPIADVLAPATAAAGLACGAVHESGAGEGLPKPGISAVTKRPRRDRSPARRASERRTAPGQVRVRPALTATRSASRYGRNTWRPDRADANRRLRRPGQRRARPLTPENDRSATSLDNTTPASDTGAEMRCASSRSRRSG